MTSLRRRMTEDMQVRSLSPQTQATYVQQVSLFARYFNRSPELLGPEEIRSYQVYLTNERRLAPSSIILAVAALRFLYKITLHKDWSLTEVIPTPKKPKKLPIVPSPEEVLQFLGCVWNIKHRTILTTCYAAGLRVSEAVCLKVTDIDSKRMVIRDEQGKGRLPEGASALPYSQTDYASFLAARVRRASAGIGHRRAHDPAAAGSLQPR